jgi:mono/diheme cytochrome c family protein
MNQVQEDLMKIFQVRAVAVVAAFILTVAVSAFADSADDKAAVLYKSKCQACHGADGAGNTPAGKKVGAKDFHDPQVAKMSDSGLFDITKKGKNKMPAYDKKLTDDQIKELVEYIRKLK